MVWENISRLKAPTHPYSIGSAPNGNGATPISGTRAAKNVANEAKITMMGQREGRCSPRPRQNSSAAMTSSGATRPEDSMSRYGTLAMKPGTKQTASQSAGNTSTALHKGRRQSKARAPCQQQANEATSAALPRPTLIRLSVPRHMYSADVMLPSKSDALHQPNHGAARCFSQNTMNSPPSTSLISSPNSRTVKVSIGMSNAAAPLRIVASVNHRTPARAVA